MAPPSMTYKEGLSAGWFLLCWVPFFVITFFFVLQRLQPVIDPVAGFLLLVAY